MVGAWLSVAVVIVVVVVLVVVVVVMGCGGRGRDRDPAAKKGEMVVAVVAGMVVGAQMVSVSQEHTESQSIEVAKRVVQWLLVVVVQGGRIVMVLISININTVHHCWRSVFSPVYGQES